MANRPDGLTANRRRDLTSNRSGWFAISPLEAFCWQTVRAKALRFAIKFFGARHQRFLPDKQRSINDRSTILIETSTIGLIDQRSATIAAYVSTQNQRADNAEQTYCFCMSNNSERIRAIAPGNATYYRLKMSLSDNSVRIFPAGEGAFYSVSEPPYQAPAGSYLLSFYDAEQRPVVGREQTFVIHLQSDLQRSPQGQLPLNFQFPGSAGAVGQASGSAAPSAPAVVRAGAAEAVLPPAGSSPKPSEAVDQSADLEFRKYLHAMDLEERQQDFIRNSTYVKEVGELFLLNRLMRRDMMEMQRSMVLHSQQAFRDIDQVKTTYQGIMEIQSSLIKQIGERQSAPVAPPPDYVGLGHSAIALLKDVSVALIQRGQPDRGNVSTAAPPQLTGPSAAPAASSAPAAETVPPADVIERIGKRLKTLTEFDLAQAMSSPQAWSALLQSCQSQATTPGVADEKPAAPSEQRTGG